MGWAPLSETGGEPFGISQRKNAGGSGGLHRWINRYSFGRSNGLSMSMWEGDFETPINQPNLDNDILKANDNFENGDKSKALGIISIHVGGLLIHGALCLLIAFLGK